MTAATHRPTVAEIDLGALRHNFRALRALAPGGELMVVVKADAYGHGAVTVARTLLGEGCRHFGVATLDEARELREAGISSRIYLQAGFFPEQARHIVELDLTPFVFDVALIGLLDDAAIASGRRDFPIHLKIDSGATRLGVMPPQIGDLIAAVRRAKAVRLEGVCTLLANAGDPSSPITDAQLRVFHAALDTLAANGMRPEIVHVANSAALVMRQDSHFNFVRPGLAIYGLPPVPAVRERVALRPVMTFKTRLMQLKNAPAGSGVGYGHTFIAPRDCMIGVLPVGYADGYRRGLQHGGEVIVRGARAPVVGAVSMDLTTIDVTDVPDAAVGDEVILWGAGGADMISVNDVARLAQTISYEMLCTVGRRVPRISRE
ncbi:MAG: alanine racemase [Candidatus Binatus sp.]|uniref:alanine racemase n=1 Tax=Candidatus Binatus sp. TaxID=2811406 RepID=UPI00271BDDE6|nr:alanine racemase [Candidatus Binatus sp.]MDO8434333.1 alanine racemase [Candidatus Binatus sp.]